MSQKGNLKRKTVINELSVTHPRLVDPGVRLFQAVPALVNYYSVFFMVLGGCCTNVWAYEQLLKLNPRIGSALTFTQMLFITAQLLPAFLSFPSHQRPPSLKNRQVPLGQWALQVLVLITGSLLNNWAFAYNVPLTVLIVFRSAGLAVSMLFGRFFLKKSYSAMQVISVVLVSIGVVLATLSRPSDSATPLKCSSMQPSEDLRKYTTGVIMLTVSLVLTGLLGLLQERTYQTYGPCWKEGVFYTHLLSLPIFLFLIPDIKQGLSSLSSSSTSSIASSYSILAVNLLSQLICVSGVNRLSSQVSSVSTNLVLTIRKALSLCFSLWWFGNGWNTQLGFGAALVFIGSVLFTVRSKEKGDKKD